MIRRAAPAFVALAVADDHVAQTAAGAPASTSGDDQVIRIELQPASTTITMAWPVTAGARPFLRYTEYGGYCENPRIHELRAERIEDAQP